MQLFANLINQYSIQNRAWKVKHFATLWKIWPRTESDGPKNVGRGKKKKHAWKVVGGTKQNQLEDWAGKEEISTMKSKELLNI